MCTLDGSLRAAWDTPQVPGHTAIIPVIKLRTERHHDEPVIHLLVHIRCRVRAILGD